DPPGMAGVNLGNVQMFLEKGTPAPEGVDIVIPVSGRPAYVVNETDSSLTLTLYSVAGQPQSAVALASPSYVRSVASVSSGADMQYTFSLRGPAYGYQPLWQDSAFTLRVRRPPPIDPTDPLRGLTIAIDPGHPPIGATGPTGLWEPVAALGVGLKVRDMLQARGVNVFMTRTTSDPVDLNLRPTMARRANAHALVSIHLNAVPDGMNPFRSAGTTTYYYWMHSTPLANATHQALLAELSLADKGVKRENFALVRPTWMPAILCEGAFIIMPDQEAALRTPEYQERYARGIVNGLDKYFRSLGQAAH
ncbi:MAG: N-acetylmuramoyl-L-alanine amidase, partial [Gemmatimonadales bacterium]